MRLKRLEIHTNKKIAYVFIMMRLSELKINTYAIILSNNIPNNKTRIRLLEMGLTPGCLIKVTKIAPMKDPIAIELRGYELCISKHEASYIFITIKK